MQVYKSAGKNNEYIVTLELSNDSRTNLKRENVTNAEYAKYRCSKALVVDIEHKETGEKESCVFSNYTNDFVYTVNEMVKEKCFDDELETVCTNGIHFFKTKKQALMYKTIQKNGEYKEWYENGQLYVECVYKDDKIEGEYKEWYENGQLYAECVYKNGIFDGEYKEWYENGKLRVWRIYKDGIYKN